MARIVLVHGAFGGAWCWDRVTPALERAGHRVETLDLPGAGNDETPVEGVTLESCAARVCEVLDRGGPAMLVGHSMGGVVTTQAASMRSHRVRSLVFVSAFMPRDGQSLLDLTRLPEGAGDMIQANVQITGDPPVAHLPNEITAAAIYNSCTDDDVAWAVARRRPQAVAPYATPVAIDDELLDATPRSYVITLADHSLPTALQRRMVSEHPCESVVELDADHAPYLSATDELVGALLSMA